MDHILVITPVKAELNALVQALAYEGHESERSTMGDLPLETFPTLGIKCSLGGHGKAQFATQTQFLLAHVDNISRVCCVGAAGGLADAVATFDVVIAEKPVEHDYKIRFDERDPPSHPGHPETIRKLKEAMDGKELDFRVHFGIIASGDEDIVTRARAQQLKDQFGATAVAWEGAGGARACAFTGIPFLEIRGITDVANNDAPEDFSENLQTAMRNVANVLLASVPCWLEKNQEPPP